MDFPRHTLRRRGQLVTLVCFLFCSVVLLAQTNEERNMGVIINGLQTGSMNWNRFAPDIKLVIAAQTGGTGRYLGLAALGPPLRIKMLNVFQLPAGFYYVFESRFASGTLQWQVVTDVQGNIWNLNFQPSASNIGSTPVPDDTEDPKPEPKSTPKKKKLPVGGQDQGDAPTSKDEACKLFPNLC